MACLSVILPILAVLALSQHVAGQSPPLPPQPYNSNTPSTSPSNLYCDLLEVPEFYDATACSLTKWGGAVVVAPGGVIGATFSNLDSTRAATLAITISTPSVTLYNPSSPVIPGYIGVVTGICPTYATAQTCLAGIDTTTGTFNSAFCPTCLASSLNSVLVPYSYLNSGMVATANASTPALSLVRYQSPLWLANSTSLFVFIGSVSSLPVTVTVNATAAFTVTPVRSLPPASPGSFDAAAAPLPLALSATMMLALALALVLCRLSMH